jgi:hypothetical protein
MITIIRALLSDQPFRTFEIRSQFGGEGIRISSAEQVEIAVSDGRPILRLKRPHGCDRFVSISHIAEIEVGVGEIHPPSASQREAMSRWLPAQETFVEASRELEQVRGHWEAAGKWLKWVEDSMIELRESEKIEGSFP